MKKLYFSLFTLLFFFVANSQIVNIPDASFKNSLLSAYFGNQIASTETPDALGNVTTYTSIDTNGNGEIEVSEASVIKYLKPSSTAITNITGINSFTNLRSLVLHSTLLISLDVSGLTNLVNLRCQNNSQMSNLNINGLSNLKRLSCITSELTSLNTIGLTSIENINCSYNNLTSVDVSGLPTLKVLNCFENPITTLNFTGLTNLESINCSNTSISNINVSGLTNLKSLNCGYNQLSNLNLTGLSNLEDLNCLNTQLQSLDVSNFSNLITLSVGYNNNLTTLNIKNNNLNWSSLDFSNCPNLNYICSDEEDIAMVQTKVNSYGLGATCQVNSYCFFTPGGTYYTIQGHNKVDGNSNGCDASDNFYPNLKYSISNGTISGTLISNASGNYSIPVSAGTHTFTPQFENPTHFAASPTSSTVSFPATASPFVQDFCIVPNGVHHDLEVVIIPLEPARPGFDATYKIKYINKGTVSETATLVFNFDDAVLDFVSSTLTPTSSSSGSLSWNIGTITPFQSGEFVVTLNVNSPMETPAVNGGDVLIYTATINGLNTDETPFDNQAALKQTVLNSYDPNDKTCLEGTTINPTMIGEYVHYQIRFENTGTYPAENIVVKDMIDTAKFDISTLQITDTSHSCVTRITNPNKVEFIFENINLPFNDATNDGYVVFKIKTKPTLTVGSTISNLANIYFDYNFPIVTNTATSTFQTLASNQFNLDNYLSLSPNPAKDILNINIQDEVNIKSIAIYNMLGQLIQITTNPTNSINISDLKTGNYIIKLHTEKGEISGKFIKE
ncbi:T9SS type A sorting domain-containing protein [Flavobacterium sp.]|uniref:DUF7619 domain-containing protein n=1 Tax=Flavobacterium sp. TaxID=239 RepID=UPI0026061927|nr:T9SS type A sorting domain-containing protein [Flavobacterium sp.]